MTLLALPLLIGCDCSASSLEARCRTVRDDLVSVRLGARVSPGAIAAGAEASCHDEDAARLTLTLNGIVDSLPEGSRPRLVVLLDPEVEAGQAPVAHVEVHRASGAILVDRSAVGSIDHTAWLHEIAHARMRRVPAPGPMGERLLAAAEEGVADYHAAAHAGTPRLGEVEGGVVRNLDSPPRLTALDWASLSGVGPPRVDARYTARTKPSAMRVIRRPAISWSRPCSGTPPRGTSA